MLKRPQRFRCFYRVMSLVAVLSGCTDHVTTEPAENPPRSIPSHSILDGANGGNPHFYFLPPLRHTASFSGVFDPTVRAEIEICELGPNNVCGRKVGTFATDATVREEKIKVSQELQHYLAFWPTTDASLSHDAIYRIRVMSNGFELGHVDLDPVRSKDEIPMVGSSEFKHFVLGSWVAIPFRIEQGALGAVTMVGAEGGTLQLGSSVSLTVPAGALSTPTELSMSIMPPVATGVLMSLEFGPSGTQFAEPATISIDVPRGLVPEGTQPWQIALAEGGPDGAEILSTSSFDPATYRLTAKIEHFSNYELVYLRGTDDLACLRVTWLDHSVRPFPLGALCGSPPFLPHDGLKMPPPGQYLDTVYVSVGDSTRAIEFVGISRSSVRLDNGGPYHIAGVAPSCRTAWLYVDVENSPAAFCIVDFVTRVSGNDSEMDNRGVVTGLTVGDDHIVWEPSIHIWRVNWAHTTLVRVLEGELPPPPPPPPVTCTDSDVIGPCYLLTTINGAALPAARYSDGTEVISSGTLELRADGTFRVRYILMPDCDECGWDSDSQTGRYTNNNGTLTFVCESDDPSDPCDSDDIFGYDRFVVTLDAGGVTVAGNDGITMTQRFLRQP